MTWMTYSKKLLGLTCQVTLVMQPCSMMKKTATMIWLDSQLLRKSEERKRTRRKRSSSSKIKRV